jgi:hypothetical protein
MFEASVSLKLTGEAEGLPYDAGRPVSRGNFAQPGSSNV